MPQEFRISLFALPVSGCARTVANSGVVVCRSENRDAAGYTLAAKGKSATGRVVIDRNVHLVLDRVSRNRMGARFRRRAGVLDIGIPTPINDAEYRTGCGQSEVVVTAGKEVMIVTGIVPNFVVTVQIS